MDYQSFAAASASPGATTAASTVSRPVLVIRAVRDEATVERALRGLATRRRMVAVDAQAPIVDLVDIIRESSLPFHVVGIGAAGGVAATLAHAYQELVRSVVVVDSRAQDAPLRTPQRTLVLSGNARQEDAVVFAAALGGDLLRLPSLRDVIKDANPGYLSGILETFWAEVDSSPATRRALATYTECGPDLRTATDRWKTLVAEASPAGDLSFRALTTTGGYGTDPNRPQRFQQLRAAIQVDYGQADEPLVLDILSELGLPRDGDVPPTLAVGDVLVCLPPVGRFVLLLGARRKPGLTFGEFRRYWSLAHAPVGTEAFRAAAIPLGYELFLVDHATTDAQDGGLWCPDWVDGWMHITSAGADDFSAVEQDPERRAWVLEDEKNFVDFEAPMTGQQMHAQSIFITNSTQ